MLEKNISAIVLAAGRGKRMKGYYPKVLYSLLGKPLIYYVLKELTAIDCIKQIIVVIGYKRDLVKSEVSKLFKNYKNLEFVYQNKLLGTADAVRKAEYKVRYPNVLIMCADTPLITKNTLSSFIKTYFIDKKPCYLITANIEKDTDLGRVLRDDKGNISAICEKLEFNKGEASEFKEVNSGIYIFKKDVLFKNLKKIKLNKKKKEY
ncbi:MAG: sugar phosphate nucleotidyltransferase, partial [Candidatus Aenigmatarchaeota archaeon]